MGTKQQQQQPTGAYSLLIQQLDEEVGVEREWYATGNTLSDVGTDAEQTLGDVIRRLAARGKLVKQSFEVRNFTHETIDDGMCMSIQTDNIYDRAGNRIWSLYNPFLEQQYSGTQQAIVALFGRLVQQDGYIMATRFHFPLGE